MAKIGFHADMYCEKLAVIDKTSKKKAVSAPEQPEINIYENRYFNAIFDAMNEFIKRDMGPFYGNSSDVLMKKIEAARTLFEKDRQHFAVVYRKAQDAIG